MRTKIFIKHLCFSLLLGAMISGCSSDDNNYPGPAPKQVNAAYFSGGSASGNNLQLLYSGYEWNGKEARFHTSDGEKANITLKNIIPGEELTSFEVNLTPTSESYSFSGATTTGGGSALTYSGTVQASLLSLSLKVEQPAHILTGTWKLAPIETDPATEAIMSLPFRVTWEADGESGTMAAQLSTLLSSLGSAYVQQYLQSVTFGSDGNASAMYRTNLPETTWGESPLNLCSFYVKNSTLYIAPDIRMITELVQKNNALRTASLHATGNQANTRAMTTLEIISLVVQVLQWGQEGIPLQIRNNNDGTVSLFMDKTAIGPIIPLIPTLLEYLPMDETVGGMISDLVGQMNAILPQTTRLEVGIELSK